MMDQTLKRLTLLVPDDLGEALLETLLELRPGLPGFTTLAVSGHGERFDGASVREHVRGRIERRMAWLVLPAEDVTRVLQQLRERMPHPDIVWWVEPVEDMGRIA
jgi:hypothetical protein